MKGYVYVARNGSAGATISTAITITQVKAGATTPLEILRLSVSQTGLTASAMQRIWLVRKSTAATVTAFTPLEYSEIGPAAAAAGATDGTGFTGSAEGTDTDVVVHDTFNQLNGWVWLPTPEERMIVDAAGIIALKFPAAPTSATWIASIVFRELR